MQAPGLRDCFLPPQVASLPAPGNVQCLPPPPRCRVVCCLGVHAAAREAREVLQVHMALAVLGRCPQLSEGALETLMRYYVSVRQAITQVRSRCSMRRVGQEGREGLGRRA